MDATAGQSADGRVGLAFDCKVRFRRCNGVVLHLSGA
jgi:hypothetical protein